MLSTNAFCVGFPSWVKFSFTPDSLAQKNIALEFRTAIPNNRLRKLARLLAKLSGDPMAGNRKVYYLQNKLPRIIINNI